MKRPIEKRIVGLGVGLMLLLAVLSSSVHAQCDTADFMRPRTGCPPYLKWPDGASISIGCSNCNQTEKDIIGDAAGDWVGVSNGKYSISTT